MSLKLTYLKLKKKKIYQNNNMKSKLCAKGFKVKMLLKRVNPDLDEYFTQV